MVVPSVEVCEHRAVEVNEEVVARVGGDRLEIVESGRVDAIDAVSGAADVVRHRRMRRRDKVESTDDAGAGEVVPVGVEEGRRVAQVGRRALDVLDDEVGRLQEEVDPLGSVLVRPELLGTNLRRLSNDIGLE